MWDLAKIESYISSKIEEGLSLEYKSAGALSGNKLAKTEITKDVSAMANAEGGVIIYGIAEFSDKPKRHLPEKIDPVSRLEISREWLDQIISNIRPKISGLIITPIPIPGNDDHVVYVVDIPRSKTAHQAADFIYYKRYNFEIRPLADNEVRDIMNRQQLPTLRIDARWVPNNYQSGGWFNFQIHNESDVLIRHYSAIIHMPVVWEGKGLAFEDYPLVSLDDGKAIRLQINNTGASPLFPRDAVLKNFEFRIVGYNPVSKTISNVRYKVYADAMPFMEGDFEINKILPKNDKG
jgi:hypothetical protein